MIILAGALGAFALLALLFRRLRRLSRQHTQLRVERDCERILRDIGMTPVAETNLIEVEDAQGPLLINTPVRRKGHLSLYLGKDVAAYVSARRNSRHLAVATGTVVFATAAVVAALMTAPESDITALPDDGPDIVTPAAPRLARSPSRTRSDPSDPVDSAAPDRWDSTTDVGMKVATVGDPSPQPVGSIEASPRQATPSPPDISEASRTPPTQLPSPSPEPTASSDSPILNLCSGVEPVLALFCLGL